MKTIISIALSILLSSYKGNNEKFLNNTVLAYKKIMNTEKACEVLIQDNTADPFMTLVTEQKTKIIRKPNAVTRMSTRQIIFNRQWLNKKETTTNQIIKVLFHEMGHCEFDLKHGKDGTIMDNNLSTADQDILDLVLQFLEEVNNKDK